MGGAAAMGGEEPFWAPRWRGRPPRPRASASWRCRIALVVSALACAAASLHAGPALALPDGRGYELVSTAAGPNAEAFVPTAGRLPVSEEDGIFTDLPFQTAAGGDAIAYVGSPGSGEAGGDGIYGASAGNEYLAERSPAGWTSVDIQPTGVIHARYQAFSPDLSAGILDSSPNPLAAGAPPGNVLYERASADGGYEPIFTAAASNERYLEAHGVLDDGELGEAIAYAGASEGLGDEGLGDVLFEANDALPSTPASVDGGEAENNLYDSAGGRLYLVNVLPGGTPRPNATFGAPPEAEPETEEQEENGPDFSHAISTNGARVFWTALKAKEEEGKIVEEPRALYVRENATSETGASTVQIDATQGGSGPGGGGRFWTANSEGSRVFFTDSPERGLTGDTQPGSGTNLYEYDVESGALTDLTPSADARVQGVVAASEDGSYVYFVAGGALATGAKSQACEPKEAGEGTGCNLYVYHAGAPTPIALIATLDSRDGHAAAPFGTGAGHGNNGDWQPGLGLRTAQATPDGRHLVFMSSASLKTSELPSGYPNEGMQEVYLYDAETAELTCVSCGPGDAPPPIAGEVAQGAAAFVPISHSNTYMQRFISADGNRVFFDSPEPLVSEDGNGRQDVYEWERDGEGSCEAGPGCVYLLSGGTSAAASWLLDASSSGEDVFIITRAQLSGEDHNDAYEVYDVRVGATQPAAPAVCAPATPSACQPEPPPPASFSAPASAGFVGTGNLPPAAGVEAAMTAKPKPLTRAQKLMNALRACRKLKKHRRRAACERRAHARYARTASRKSKSSSGRSNGAGR